MNNTKHKDGDTYARERWELVTSIDGENWYRIGPNYGYSTEAEAMAEARKEAPRYVAGIVDLGPDHPGRQFRIRHVVAQVTQVRTFKATEQ